MYLPGSEHCSLLCTYKPAERYCVSLQVLVGTGVAKAEQRGIWEQLLEVQGKDRDAEDACLTQLGLVRVGHSMLKASQHLTLAFISTHFLLHWGLWALRAIEGLGSSCRFSDMLTAGQAELIAFIYGVCHAFLAHAASAHAQHLATRTQRSCVDRCIRSPWSPTARW